MNKQLIIILKSFPKISETFILQELVLLTKNNYKPIIYARVKPKEEKIVHKLVDELNLEVRYLPRLNFRSKIKLFWILLKMIYKFDAKLIIKLLIDAYKKSRNNIYRQSILCFFGAIWIINDLKLKKGANYHMHPQFLDYPAEITNIIYKITKIEYSISSHAKDIYTTPKELIQEFVSNATHIKTCTKYNYKYLCEATNTPEKIHMIYHGINCDFFSKSKLKKQIRLISIARLVEKKGFFDILKALSILKIRYPDFIYTIIGHGELHDEIIKHIDFLNLNENIQIIPYATQEVVRDYLSFSDVFINASLITKNGDRDGIPNSIAEAMAMEVPVIGTEVSGITELLKHKQTGYLAESKNAMSIYEGILFFLENEDLKDEIVQNAHRYIFENFHYLSVFKKCEEFYMKLVND